MRKLLLLLLLASAVVVGGVRAAAEQPPPAAPDLTKPSITFDGELLDHRVLDGGAWDVDITATDGTAASPSSGVKRISVRIGGQAPQTEDNSECDAATSCEQTMTFTFDASELAPGSHTITATAIDRAGNRGVRTLKVTTARVPSGSACNPAKYDVYNAGNSVANRVASSASKNCSENDDGSHSTSTTYGYGTCDPGDDESCAIPLTVSSAPLCERHAALYTDGSGKAPAYRKRTVKGVPAAEFGSGTLEIYTGRTTITVSGSRALMAQAVRRLRRPPQRNIPTVARSLSRLPAADHRASPARLPAPDRTILRRKTAC